VAPAADAEGPLQRKAAAVARTVIRDIESLIAADPGNRGIGPLALAGELYRAATTLYRDSVRRVGIATGFFILRAGAPETDGPLGALAIARSLLRLGKKVTILTDEPCRRMMELAIEKSGLKASLEPLFIFPHALSQDSQWSDCFDKLAQQFDHLVSIERCGAAADGKYYNMRALDITQFTAPIDRFFGYARETKRLGTTGIGDGGNEIGMGKVAELVKLHVPGGDVIACTTATDTLIVTGISNWGGYALAAALQLLHAVESAALDPEMLVSRQQDSDILDAILAVGAVDGPLCQCIRSVDGVAFDEYVVMLESMRTKVDSAWQSF